jgi:hypothetical protein
LNKDNWYVAGRHRYIRVPFLFLYFGFATNDFFALQTLNIEYTLLIM